MKKQTAKILPQIGILIPAFEPNSAHLAELFTRLQSVMVQFDYRVLVVDDGSQPPIVLPENIGDRAKLIRHAHNRGKGAALKSGFRFFLNRKNIDVIITLDADLQHPPEKIPDFLRLHQSGKYRLIGGYRSRSPRQMPFHRILSNTLTSLIISLLINQPVRDSQCGFRLIDTNLLRKLHLREERFHLESELFVRAGWKKFKIGFVPISTIYNNEKSSIKNVSDTLNFITMIFKLLRERAATLCFLL
ncbi:hypothetical protein B1H10_07000 [candidate division KSB1 bacterium 4484_188]|nr:MAG: hypothetical protein B1H10_07000 [candidate division KSB1 bacterium 4484_188]